MFTFHPWRVLWGKVVTRHLPGPRFSYDEIVKGEVWAITDLGAYQKPLQGLPGITGVVIMEDRFPEFFLSYRAFEGEKNTHLNTHGPLREYRSHEDLRALVTALRRRRIKVLIGFWNYFGWKANFWQRPSWVRLHRELHAIPGSSDINPFVTLQKEGISYADYIGRQYRKCRKDFGFDGLFLGDGFSGYRSFSNPLRYRDKADTIHAWEALYRTIASAVHREGGLLFAYDCMSLSFDEAKLHGADYSRFSGVGLDYLVFQSYPQAWGEYWLSRSKERFTPPVIRQNLVSVVEGLKNTATKVLYTVELRDRREGWSGDPAKTERMIALLDPLSHGRVLVWANDLFANLK